jgi:flagellar hook-associated protein 3 FlgL
MRADPLYVFNLAGSLNQTSATEELLSEELSSGKSVNAIGDNPIAAGENVLISSELSLDDTFSQTASSTESMLQVSDSTLGSVVSQLTKAISLATEANNGTMSSDDLKSIATELTGIRDEVLSLANTTYLGQYVFSGSQGGTQPFTLNSASTPATTTYNGDSDVTFLQTPNRQKIQLNVPGNQIFSAAGNDVLGTLNNLIADFSSGTASSTAQTDTTALTSALNYVGEQRVTIDNSITRLTAAQTYTEDESTQLELTQTNLLQADVGQVATGLSTAETQQAALTQVIAALGKGSLFDAL